MSSSKSICQLEDEAPEVDGLGPLSKVSSIPLFLALVALLVVVVLLLLEPASPPLTGAGFESSPSKDPHHKSSYILLSAAIAAAWMGLSAVMMSLLPPNRFGPVGNSAPVRARFSAAANAVCRRDGKGG